MTNPSEFSEHNYFKVPLDQIPVARPLAGPLYLYLAKNDRLILRFQAGQVIVPEALEFYRNNKLDFLWCPKEFKAAWNEQATHAGPSGVPQGAPNDSDLASTGEAAVAIDVLNATGVDATEKQEVLVEITSDVLSLLGAIGSGTPEEAKQAISQVRGFGVDVIRSVAKRHPLKSLQDELESLKAEEAAHAQVVSSFCMVFSIGVGITDVKVLGDIAFAALLHDIGLVALNDISLMMTPELKMSREQNEVYHKHVEEGVKLLRARAGEIPENVINIIEQHHEYYDGSGFPAKISGAALTREAQILGFCDRLDDFMSGRIDGIKHTPADAIQILVRQESGGSNRRHFSPEFFKQISQFIRKTTVDPEKLPKKAKAG